jgi:polyphosphate kinase
LGTQSDPGRFLNRELSWLDFNDRVLSLAEIPDLPLLERVRFLSIASRNLDEFFQVRVAVLNARYEAQLPALSPDGLNAEEQLEVLRERVLRQMATAERIAEKTLFAELAAEDIQILDWGELRKRERREATQTFEEQIFPVLTPLAVDPAHPFPYVSNLSCVPCVLRASRCRRSFPDWYSSVTKRGFCRSRTSSRSTSRRSSPGWRSSPIRSSA